VEVRAEITGTVWKITAEIGQRVQAGETLVILESMKMEIPVDAPADGVIEELRTAEGAQVSDGEVLVVLGP
jgi:acetyl-CoA carboxylase biotin carboxyl carrier protein